MRHWYDTVANQSNVLVPNAIVTVLGVASQLAFDNFNRANANPVGAPWLGTAQLLSNGMALSSLSAFDWMLYDAGIVWPANQYTRAVVGQLVKGSGYLALVLRGDATHQNGYYIDLDANVGFGGLGIPTPINLQKLVSGVLQGPPYHSFGTVVPQAGDVFTAQIVGNIISVFQNGTQVGTFTDTLAPISSGKPGLLVQSGGGTTSVSNVVWDNWAGGATTPTNGLAVLFSDDGITQKANPTTTNALGSFDFFVADGVYDIQVSGAGISTFTQRRVEIADLTEAQVGDTAWQTELLNLADQGVVSTPPVGFMSLYTKAAPKHLFVKDDSGNETDLFTSVGSGAQPPLNSFQYNNSGGLGGSQFIYNPDDSTNLICAAPCVTWTSTGQNAGLQFTSPGGNNVIIFTAQDGVFGAGLTVQTQVTNGSNTQGQGSVSFISGSVPGGSCFATINDPTSPPCAQAYIAQPGDVVLPGFTPGGQDIVGFSAQPLFNRGGGSLGTAAGFAVNTPAQQTSGGAFVPAVEKTVNTYGLRVMDLGGLSTADSAGIKIEAQTPPGSGTQYAIEAVPNAGVGLFSDGITGLSSSSIGALQVPVNNIQPGTLGQIIATSAFGAVWANNNASPLPNAGLIFSARAIVGQTGLQTIGDASTNIQNGGVVTVSNGTFPTASLGVAVPFTVADGTGGAFNGWFPTNSSSNSTGIFRAGRNCRYQARIVTLSATSVVTFLGFSTGIPSTMRTFPFVGSTNYVGLYTPGTGTLDNWQVTVNGTTVNTGIPVTTAPTVVDIIINDAPTAPIQRTMSFSVNGNTPTVISGNNLSGFNWFPTATFAVNTSVTHNFAIEYFYAQQDF